MCSTFVALEAEAEHLDMQLDRMWATRMAVITDPSCVDWKMR